MTPAGRKFKTNYDNKVRKIAKERLININIQQYINDCCDNWQGNVPTAASYKEKHYTKAVLVGVHAPGAEGKKITSIERIVYGKENGGDAEYIILKHRLYRVFRPYGFQPYIRLTEYMPHRLIY